MQKHIEDAVLAGTAVVFMSVHHPYVEFAFSLGLCVYCPVEPGRKKLSWDNPAAKRANEKRIKELVE
ncbi:hypothetical protein Psp6_00016 [Pseudomonas phage Psp6]|nr:hypothetical protein Psp6_00016 [Pseudomonas phage Psp6]